MKRRIVVTCIVITIAVLAAMITVSALNRKTDKLNRLFNIDATEITGIDIRSGQTGNTYAVETEEEISKIVEMVNVIKTSERVKTEPIAGWLYAVILHGENGEPIDITFVGSRCIEIDGVYYYYGEEDAPTDLYEYCRDYINEVDPPESIEPSPIFNIDATEITGIDIRSGQTGNTYAVETEEEISKIVEMVNVIKTSERVKTEPIAGWLYAVILHGENGEPIDITFVGSRCIEIDGVYYYYGEEDAPTDLHEYCRNYINEEESSLAS